MLCCAGPCGADPPLIPPERDQPVWREVNGQGRQGAEGAARPSGSTTSQDSRLLSSHVGMPCRAAAQRQRRFAASLLRARGQNNQLVQGSTGSMCRRLDS